MTKEELDAVKDKTAFLIEGFLKEADEARDYSFVPEIIRSCITEDNCNDEALKDLDASLGDFNDFVYDNQITEFYDRNEVELLEYLSDCCAYDSLNAFILAYADWIRFNTLDDIKKRIVWHIVNNVVGLFRLYIYGKI